MHHLKSKYISLVFSSLLFMPSFSHAEMEATTKKKSDIKAENSRKAEVIETLDANTSLTIGRRKGLWYEVIAPTTGWIFMSKISVVVPESDSSLIGLASGREGKGNSVASTGARGLGAEQLKTGQPDFQAVQSMIALTSHKTDKKFFKKLDKRKLKRG